MQLRQQSALLEEADIEVAVVTFENHDFAKAYVEQTKLPWPLLLDPDKSLYKSYGFEKADAWTIYGPASIINYLRLIFVRGRRIEKPGTDLRQLGGDVLIDPTGRVQFRYSSSSPHDRPTVERILNARQAASGR